MRAEFSKSVKRSAWDRAGGICEASGAFYGLCPGARCTNPVAEYDHVVPAANGGSADLDNCLAVCKRCHSHKTACAMNQSELKWRCKANPTADQPQDCGWPVCGCDPYANRVIDALDHD